MMCEHCSNQLVVRITLGWVSRPDKMITLYMPPFTYYINLTTLKSLSRGSVS